MSGHVEIKATCLTSLNCGVHTTAECCRPALMIQILSAEGFRTLLEEGPGKSLPENKNAEVRKPKENPSEVTETLTCVICDTKFTRTRVKGRKPHSCPECKF